MTDLQNSIIAALHKIIALGRQLVIVDVQKCFDASQNLVEPLLDYAKGFDEIIYIWDDVQEEHKDEDYLTEMMRKMKDSGIHVRMTPMRKQYGFFRGLMDTGVSEEDIVLGIQFMLKYELLDSRSIVEEAEETWIQYADKHGIEWVPEGFEGDEDYTDPLYIPEDLTNSLKEVVKKRPILVGGGRNECLQEIYLLLEALQVDPEINEKYTY